MSAFSRGSLPSLMEIYQILYAHFGHRKWWPGETQIEIIIGAILTQNTAWKNVEKAIHQLKANQLLGIPALREIPESNLAELIRPSGYFNQKARKIKAFIHFVDRYYQGSLSAMEKVETAMLRKQLLSIHGIGPETADSILLYALNKPVFVVDAYTRRVFYRHYFFSHEPGYEETQALFLKELPCDLDLYNDYHAQIVAVGNQFCKPTPRCKGCPLDHLPHRHKHGK